MADAEKKLQAETSETEFIKSLSPKIGNNSLTRELLLNAICQLFQIEKANKDDKSEEEICLDLDLGDLEAGIQFMQKNNLPEEELPKLAILVMEQYAEWLYSDIQDQLIKQINKEN